MEALAKLRESALRSLCTMVRYERHAANDILYWYHYLIIISERRNL